MPIFLQAVTDGWKQIDYVFGTVVPTLAMIESRDEKTYLAVDSPDDVDTANASECEKMLEHKHLPVEADLILVKRPLITSSLRESAYRLILQPGLRDTGRVYILYTASDQIVFWIQTLSGSVAFTPTWLIVWLATTFVADLLTIPLWLMWTHLVITRPSPGRFARLIPSWQTVRKTIPATAVNILAKLATTGLPLALAMKFDILGQLTNFGSGREVITKQAARVLLLELLAILVVALAISFLVMIPATVTLVRVRAALLPETEETLVPFDRTFNGFVVPESAGGKGTLGLLDAWRSFDWPARVGLVKLFAKVVILQIMVSIVMGTALGVELRLLLPGVLPR